MQAAALSRTNVLALDVYLIPPDGRKGPGHDSRSDGPLAGGPPSPGQNETTSGSRSAKPLAFLYQEPSRDPSRADATNDSRGAGLSFRAQPGAQDAPVVPPVPGG